MRQHSFQELISAHAPVPMLALEAVGLGLFIKGPYGLLLHTPSGPSIPMEHIVSRVTDGGTDRQTDFWRESPKNAYVLNRKKSIGGFQKGTCSAKMFYHVFQHRYIASYTCSIIGPGFGGHNITLKLYCSALAYIHPVTYNSALDNSWTSYTKPIC